MAYRHTIATRKDKRTLEKGELEKLEAFTAYGCVQDDIKDFYELKTKTKIGVKEQNSRTSYEGTPESWPVHCGNDQLMNINPENHTENCVNCCIAFEMRRRGRKVCAGKSIENLKQNPFAGWMNPEPITVRPIKGKDAFTVIDEIMSSWSTEETPEPRAQIIYTRGQEGGGHSIMADFKGGGIRFIDPQREEVYGYDKIKEILASAFNIEMCRTDQLEISDLGIEACYEQP